MGRPAVHLFLVRHGKTDWNEQGRLMGRNDVVLNDRGRTQAEAAATALACVPLSRVLASPQPRAQATARLVAAAHGLEVETEPQLAEVWLGPRWQGKTFADLGDDPDLRRYLDDSTFGSDVLEAAASVQERVASLVDRLRTESAGKYVALISHGDPLRILIAHLLGLPLADFRSLRVDTGSVSLVRLATQTQLSLLNWQPDGPATVGRI